MRMLQSAFIPMLLAAGGLYALYKGVDVFPTFLRGAKSGLKTAVELLPTMVGMLTVVYMLRASGAIDLAAAALAPAAAVWRWAARSCSAAGRTAMPVAWRRSCWVRLKPASTRSAFTAVI